MDITVLLILFFTVSAIILIVGSYKIYKWYKNELKGQLIKIQDNQERYITNDLRKRISRIRNRIAIGLLGGIVIIFIFSPSAYSLSDEKRYMMAGILFGVMMLSIIINNIIVSKLWICPYCHKKLPVRIGKAGASPKTVDECPNCKQQFIK